MNDAIRRARTAFLWVGILVPLAIIAASAIVVALWLPEIPEPSAVHWSGSGPDGFGPGWTHLVLLIGVGGGMVLLFGALAWFGRTSSRRARTDASNTMPPGQWPPTTRFLGGVNLGIAGMLSFVALVTVGVQRGLPDAADAPEIGPWVFLGFVLLAALTALGWFLQPKVAPPAARPDAAPLPLAQSERAVWVGTATMARGGMIVLGLSLLSIVVTTVLMLVRGADSWWVTGIVTLILIGVVAGSLVFRVRITDGGIVVRSIAGWPRIEIPVGEITAVRATEVSPFGEFGGWGLRYALDGRYGVVLRGGEAVEVSRTDGRRFVVTIDDAGTAAAVLAAASARA